MKKTLLVVLALLLVALSLVACGEKKTDVTVYKSQGDFVEVKHKLTQEAIDKLPVKRSDMTEEEMRQAAVEFYRLSKEFVWVAGSDLTVVVNKSLGRNFLKTGLVYQSFPYVSLGTGNIYRIMEYMDPATGVIDIARAGQEDVLFGNQCSSSTFWGWARVVNSANFCYTKDMVAANNFVPVGDYTYDFTVKEFNASYGTQRVLSENDMQTMFEAYAKVKPGDGLVHNNQSGHTIMATGETVVVRNADGTIDPEKSFIIYSDQNTAAKSGSNAEGDTFLYSGMLDNDRTFQKLYEGTYIPFTFKEFLGEDPIEDTEVTCSHSGETITKEQLFSTQVSSNYFISDVCASVYDKNGVEIYKVAARALLPGTRQLQLTEKATGDRNNIYVFGSWDDVKSGYTVKIYTQLGTGECPVLWEGKLAQ